LDDLKLTPLHLAAEKGHIEIMKFLAAEKHCDPMVRSTYSDIPLHFAMWYGHLQVVSYFIEELKCPPLEDMVT